MGLAATKRGITTGAVLVALAGCQLRPSDRAPVDLTLGTDASFVAPVGLRRLSRDETDSTLEDLLGDTGRLGTKYLPEASRAPFDNDTKAQTPSSVLIEAAENVAAEAGASLVASAVRRAAVVGCTPTRADDAACFTSFIARFGRRALRRPLGAEEIASLRALAVQFALESNDFPTGVRVVVRTLLQHPEFWYRVELGAPVSGKSGVVKLDPWAVATRLSYLLWGTTPDEQLLAEAAEGKLSTPAELRAVALRMLASPRAVRQLQRFHSLWLGYYSLPHAAALSARLRLESDSLVERVLFAQNRPWTDLFLSSETFLDDTLATHYGMPTPGSSTPVWVGYADERRRGILSHGAFLSVAAKFNDTSPTERGKLVNQRLLCRNVPPPPPEVNADVPPQSTNGSPCKTDRYAAHRRAGSCFGCHSNLDPIGFGLERFDQAGRYRVTDAGLPGCTISGDGELPGAGTFNGPAQLGRLLVENELVTSCFVEHYSRFLFGRDVAADDAKYLAYVSDRFKRNGFNVKQLLLDWVSDETFVNRSDP